jgi:MFS family permease
VSNPPARLRRASPLLVVFVCVFVDMLGYGMVVPLLPYMLRGQAVDGALAVGLLSSLYALMQLLVAPLLGALSDRIGRRPILIGCVLLAGAAYTLLGLARSLPLIFVAVAVGGAAGATIPTAQAYIADTTSGAARARGLGLVGAAFGLGLMLGPAAGGLLARASLSLPAFLAAGLCLLNGLYGLLILPESLPAERRSRQPLRLGGVLGQVGAALAQRQARPLLLAIFLLNLAFNGLQSNIPVFTLERFGWTPAQNGVFFAFVGLCAVLTQGLLIGRLQPLFGEARLVLGGLGLMAAGLPLVAVAPAGWLLYPAAALMALGTGLAIPSITSLLSGSADAGGQGALLGGVQSLLSLTLVIGPFLAGALFDAAGPGAPYLIGGLLAAGALAAAARGLAGGLVGGAERASPAHDA